jgi:hypothetical protein
MANVLHSSLTGADLHDPGAHATQHENGGTDELALDASQVTAGTVATARLGSGTANSSTFLRGDQSWATPAGGSGGGTMPTLISGRYYDPQFWLAATVNAGSIVVAGRLYAVPMLIPATVTIDRIGISVTSGSGAATTARLGIYDDDASGSLPDTLLLDCGTVLTDAIAPVEATISQSLTAGLWWFAVVFESTPQVRQYGSNPISNLGNSAINTSAVANYYYGTHAYGALPASFQGLAGKTFANAAPKIAVRPT